MKMLNRYWNAYCCHVPATKGHYILSLMVGLFFIALPVPGAILWLLTDQSISALGFTVVLVGGYFAAAWAFGVMAVERGILIMELKERIDRIGKAQERTTPESDVSPK